MSKHTAGPWEIEKCQCGHESCHTYGIKNVGTFYQGCGFDLADARLVAAAPELLAALEYILSVDDELLYPAATKQALEAIAKAKGE